MKSYKRDEPSSGLRHGGQEAVDADEKKPPEDGGVLFDAEVLVAGPRAEAYGSPSISFGRIAGMWSAYLGVHVSPKDVALMMVLLKVSRERSKHQRDNLVDVAGYTRLAEMLELSSAALSCNDKVDWEEERAG